MRTKENILQSLLHTVSANYNKQAGSFMFDAFAPVAEQLAKITQAIEYTKQQLYIDNVRGIELEQRIKERTGIERKPATYAIGEVIVTGTGTIQQGDLFETEGGIQFCATETKTITNKGTVAIKAIQAGCSGNVAAHTIRLYPVTLTGFTTVDNFTAPQDGFDAETDEALLKRYYERIRTPATSGNRAHYVNWAKDVSGVGDVRVIPLWAGNNTVKVIVIDSDKKPASAALVSAIQQYIDPNKEGMGYGQAPIGAKTTVVSAAGVKIDVSVTVVLKSGYTLQQVKSTIESDVTAYLTSIAFIEAAVSFAKIGATILSSKGVADYSQLLLNKGTTNVSIGFDQVAVLGGVHVVT